MSAARALFAAPAARQAAAVHGRAGAVELALSRGAYLKLGEDWLLLSEPGAPFGPLSIAVQRLERLELAPGAPVRVRERRLQIGDSVLSLERLRTRRTARLASAPRASADAISCAAGAARAALAPPAAALAPGLAALARGSLEEAVPALAGLGPGLTPAGDDLLAGYAASRGVLAVAPRPAGRLELPPPAPLQSSPRAPPLSSPPAPPLSSLAADRASPLGLAYLRCAERGELAEAAARLLAALQAGLPAAARAAAWQLRSWGASSGNAIAWGMIIATLPEVSCRLN